MAVVYTSVVNMGMVYMGVVLFQAFFVVVCIYNCKLIGGGSPRHLNTFSNLFIVAVHYTHQHMLCIVAIVDCTHLYHVVHYTLINTCYVLLLLLTAPMYTMLSTTYTSTHAMYCCYC